MPEIVHQLAQRLGGAANVFGVLIALALVLTVATIIRAAAAFAHRGTPETRQSRLGSLATWWVLFAVLALAVVLGKTAALVGFALISLLGLREFRTLAWQRAAGPRVWWRLAYLAVPVHYLTIQIDSLPLFWTFIPVWVLVLLLVRLVATEQSHGFLETAGITFLGLMLIVYLFSHAVLLTALPDGVNPAAGAMGLFVYLVVLTEVNDIAQALWGRRFGRRKITPVISPHKTWEGFLLGALTTVALAVVLAPLLTPFADHPMRLGSVEWHLHPAPALVAGLLIAVGGFFGDITMSAVKREVGVKDSGTLLPGQGGVLDRIDSLTFTGPLFFYFMYLFYSQGDIP